MAYDNYDKDQAFERMAVTHDDLLALMAEGQLEEWVEPTPSYTGYNAVGYLPSCGRAVWVTNGDPTWYDAGSLEDAVCQAKTNTEEDWN